MSSSIILIWPTTFSGNLDASGVLVSQDIFNTYAFASCTKDALAIFGIYAIFVIYVLMHLKLSLATYPIKYRGNYRSYNLDTQQNIKDKGMINTIIEIAAI